MIKYIIFDWSGVLSDDIDIVYNTIRKMLKEFANISFSFKDFRDKFDLPYMDFYKSLGINPKKDELNIIYERIMGKSRKKPKPFSYAESILSWLKKNDIRMVVLSSNPEIYLFRELDDYGFKKYFEFVRGGAHDKREHIMGVIKKLDATPEEILIVGDMVHDIKTGNYAGIRTAAVLSGYHKKKRLKDNEPNFLLKDIRDLKFIVNGVLL